MGKYEKVMHGGSVGDLIAALAPLSCLDYPIEFYLNNKAHVHWRIQPDVQLSLLALLEKQPYIKKTGICEGEHFDLDGWRQNWTYNLNLSDMQSKHLGLPGIDRNKKWLYCEPKRITPVVINRSPRYQQESFPWGTLLDLFGKDSVFIGHYDEYAAFTERYGRISYWHTPTYLDAAQVVNGCSVFIGNQSSMTWVAEALKKNRIMESCPKGNWSWNTDWGRDGVWNIYDGDISSIPKRIEDYK